MPPAVAAWPDPREATAVVALGSDHSVHASTDAWLARELEYLGNAHAAGVPVLGICFGAQALAAVLGGTVSRAPRSSRAPRPVRRPSRWGRASACSFTPR